MTPLLLIPGMMCDARLFAPQIAVGALLAVDNAQDFNESLILGYLRYWFTPQTSASVPPNTMLPYFNFGDPNR